MLLIFEMPEDLDTYGYMATTSQELHQLANIDVATLRKQPEYQLAKRITQRVQSWQVWVAEHPIWASWYDQILRNSASTCLNCAEAYGKGRGYYLNALLISRGEAFECFAALEIGPAELVGDLIKLVEEYIALVNVKLHEIAERPFR